MTQGEQEQAPISSSQLRANMVKHMLQRGVLRSPDIEKAFIEIPRELFLPSEIPLDRVYTDDAIVVKWNETNAATSSSSQPSLMADMLEVLDLRPGLNVLEIGAGVGYNAAIMAHILGDGALLTSVDLDPAMADFARQNLAKLGPLYERTRVVAADGSLGYLPNAPYDRIIVTVQQWEISPHWVSQLKVGGILETPLSISIQERIGMIPVFRKEADGTLVSVGASQGGFMPMRGNMAHPQARLNEEDSALSPRLLPLNHLTPGILSELKMEPELALFISADQLAPGLERLMSKPETLKYFLNGTFDFKESNLPAFSLKWDEWSPEQREAYRVYSSFLSFLLLDLQEQIGQLFSRTAVPNEIDQGANNPAQFRFESRGLVFAVEVAESSSFDLVLLFMGKAVGVRLHPGDGLTVLYPEQNRALARIVQNWQLWNSLGRPFPSSYRPLAYHSGMKQPVPGFVIHRKYYDFLIPFDL